MTNHLPEIYTNTLPVAGGLDMAGDAFSNNVGEAMTTGGLNNNREQTN